LVVDAFKSSVFAIGIAIHDSTKTIYSDFSIAKLVTFCAVAVFVSKFPGVADAVTKMLSKGPKG